MTTIAATGHMDLTGDSTGRVRDELREVLSRHAGGELTGLSCIARGSDSLFAEELLKVGGRLIVVLPSRDYRQAKVKPDHVPVFDRLLEAAAEVLVMPYETASREAYEAANKAMLERADRVVAVWNGEPPSGKGGGTADVVLAARDAGLPVDVVWPEGASRRS